MGQQQLLLIILITIVVGIATVVAINTMQSSQERSNIESAKVKMIEAASMARVYHMKNQALGGGGDSFMDIQLAHLLLEDQDEIGTFSISNRSQNSFTLTAELISGNATIECVISPDDITFNE